MMKNLPLLLLLIATQSYSQSSVYHPFPEDSVVWRMDCGGLGFSCNCTCANSNCVNSSNRQYYYGNDTIINFVNYHKVMQDQFNLDYWLGPGFCNPGCNPSPHSYSYSGLYEGALRQDVNQKIIYFIPPGNTQEEVLYDFNLNVGDTLAVSYVNIVAINRVNLIDSVLVGNNYRKRFWLWDFTSSPPGPLDSGYVALIEGIGSTYGLLEPLVSPFEFWCGLTCVNIDSVTVYPSGANNCHFLTAGIGESPMAQQSVQVTPNPAEDHVFIQWSNEADAVTVYDMLGNMILKQMIKTDGNSHSMTLNTTHWPQGMYLISVSGNGSFTTTRLMVQR